MVTAVMDRGRIMMRMVTATGTYTGDISAGIQAVMSVFDTFTHPDPVSR